MTIVPTPTKTTIHSESEYDAIYLPFGNPADSENDIWEHKDTLSYPLRQVWSVIEVDDELFAIPGYHVVNVIGYNVTKVEWPHDNIEVRFDNPHDEHDSNCKDGTEDCVV